ncbi:MAG: Transaldolase [uncultured bacterium]|uniref:Transaldolase n=1 Tax=Candidatus Gottesmanbacteria bacterium RIFCSPLOWO2_01_FULL_43_11b TaxID=1798392 RepID=A0A1F6AHC8_9BACT|nr:MAG: Transaldolase [uncultured bacterium]OGG23862.1 MAG: hypothetical protein A3A79_01510 [Candidatus Gottesmanbacteria bacterium RIFCSPLOWO2_01_FULL_43_11b]
MYFPSRIFIDGGDPAETKEADTILKKGGYHGLDGQTTNPTLIAKRAPSGVKALDFYKDTVREMSKIIPNGTISIQVIGDPSTLTSEEMVSQARDRITWIPNGIIKLPCTQKGLDAAEIFCKEGPINITLNFSQEQAAAVYVATLRLAPLAQGKRNEVYISPFVGRLDDKGEKGMDVVANILEMYRAFGDSHVKVLTASVRNVPHILYALWLKSDIITIPFKVFKEWADGGFLQPPKDYLYDTPGLTEIPYREINLDQDWKSYDLHHDLTDVGIQRFWDDWNAIVK